MNKIFFTITNREDYEKSGICDDWAEKVRCIHPLDYILINPLHWEIIKQGRAIFPVETGVELHSAKSQ